MKRASILHSDLTYSLKEVRIRFLVDFGVEQSDTVVFVVLILVRGRPNDYVTVKMYPKVVGEFIDIRFVMAFSQFKASDYNVTAGANPFDKAGDEAFTEFLFVGHTQEEPVPSVDSVII